ncbi:P-loop ATPase [candidate division WS5 bacterium]|uniref:P-loop ATPase n=1 Tax=candidate division WS5 bacterium TaxID=2093353 RepID=A0A419DFP3_9BACT|nr:MAG: P-loop ATPase [candidate division WS5 bacterium]
MISKDGTKFKESLSDFRIITANLVMLIKTAFLGILSAEIWYISFLLSNKINGWIFLNNYENEAIKIGVVATTLLFVYLLARGIFSDTKRVLKSGRIDVLVAFCFGIWLSVAWGGFLSVWSERLVSPLNIVQILTIASAPFILGVLVMLRQTVLIWSEKKRTSSFIADKELDKKEADLLNFSGKAERFAEQVFNGGSPESFVFGVDAPWGIGKSTFINFCKEYWEEKYTKKIVVYKFSPLRYLGTANLLEIFIDGLIHAIQKDSFIPEIKPLISRYARLLKEIGRFSLFGLTLPSIVVDYTADEACDDLGAVLKRFPKKVIIVIDDLDRINFEEIKDILFVIRKSFAFPNVSYVICYDTENIGILEAETPDIEKVGEFLEKFVNIKISLYLDRKDLENYLSENLGKALTTSIVDPLPVRQAIGGLLDIYQSPAYHRYLPFIGDVRKLKRLINTVMMFDLQSTNFQSSDFDKKDLINLLLIYIHYPNVFRKIYDTETKGGRGFFSLVVPYDDGYPKDQAGGQGRSSFSDSSYKNSTYYHDYLKKFPEDSHQRFLLDQIFNAEVRLKTDKNGLYGNDYANIDRVPEDVRTSLACFNGGWTNGRNLETYLDLIVNLSKPEDIGQHRFYMAWREKIVEKITPIALAFTDPKFAYAQGEYTREKLWRILVNNARELPSDVAKEIITYLLDTIPEYSLLEMGDPNVGMGLRHNLDYFLTRLLNDAGWTDPAGKHSNNVEPHIAEIAEWIFGDGRHASNGVLSKLSEENRGVLGIHDLMLFRLSCSADRGGDIFDLSRAIAQHANKDAPTQGSTRDIAREEMREISQKVFEIFNARYILPKKNIFEEIDALQTSDLVGKYGDFLNQKIADGIFQATDITKKTIELKTRVGAFILYQMANSEINHGAGCGFYDPTGTEDKHTIKDLINDYLFDYCFDPKDVKNAEYFIDYLFRNFASAFASAREGGLKYVPSINEFTKVLDKVKLAIFWQKNGKTFKDLKLEDKDKIVFVGNDEASYKKYVPMVYKVLDDNITDVAEATAKPATTLISTITPTN